MNGKLILKKCSKCNAIIRVNKDCTCDDCGIICCNKKMEDIVENSVEASFEKHLPIYEKDGNDIVVKVNHIMEKDHYIEWICCISENREEYVHFIPDNQNATARFNDIHSGSLYSYCNKHGLWKTEIK